MTKLEGNTATLGLCNTLALTIKVVDDENLQYQYSNEDQIHDAKIEYLEDKENTVDPQGYFDNETYPAFKTEEGQVYFLGEFIRDNFGIEKGN
jgi:hypothetical protein